MALLTHRPARQKAIHSGDKAAEHTNKKPRYRMHRGFLIHSDAGGPVDEVNVITASPIAEAVVIETVTVETTIRKVESVPFMFGKLRVRLSGKSGISSTKVGRSSILIVRAGSIAYICRRKPKRP